MASDVDPCNTSRTGWWGDEARRLIEEHLGPPARKSPDGLKAVYYCPISGQTWLRDHPNRSGQDPGPMRIRIFLGSPFTWQARDREGRMALLSEYGICLVIAADGKLSAGRYEKGVFNHTDVSVSPDGVRAMAEDWLFILNGYTDDLIDTRMLREALEEGVVSELHTGSDD